MDYIALHVEFLKFLGLWTLENASTFKKRLYRAMHLFIFCFLGLFYETCALVTCFSDFNDFHRTLQSVAIFSFNGITIMRLVFWRANLGKLLKFHQFYKTRNFEFDTFSLNLEDGEFRRRFERLVKLTKNRCTHYRTYEDFQSFWNVKMQLKAAERDQSEIDSQQNRISQRANMHCFVLVLSLCSVVIFDCVMTFVCALFWGEFYTEKTLPFGMLFPFDLKHGNNYMIAWTYNLFACNYVSLSFCFVDFFVITVLIIFEAEVRIVRLVIERIGNDCPHTLTKDAEEKLADIQLTACVNKLQDILRCMEMLEDVFNIPLTIQYLLGTVIVCTILYILPEEQSTFFQVSLFTFLSMVLLEPLIMGWYSQSLTDEMSHIQDSLYRINWPEMSSKFCKKVNINIARFQKPVVLTLGKFAPINLQVFIIFAKRSYSFYTLIQDH